MSFRNVLLATASTAACAICLPCQAASMASSILTNAVTIYVGNSDGTANPDGIAMFATFTPNMGLTLAQAAKDLGYIGFEWQQTITNWPDPTLHHANGTLLTPVPTKSNPPFLDPPSGGYNYNPCGGTAPGASAAAAYPFYFYINGSSSDCWSLAWNEDESDLYFDDEPMDSELTAADISARDIPEFTTELVGIESGDIPGPELFEWTWNTTYNGHVGGSNGTPFISTSANDPRLNPGIGGTPGTHITITSINGVPVPEPPALFLLASGVLALLTGRKAADWNRTRYRSS